MKKILLILLVLCFSLNTAMAFGSRKNAKEIANQIPELKNVSCTFTQKKTRGDIELNSGGNFQFIKDKGVVFETMYPIHMITGYESPRTKHINDIILAVAKKDYTYLDKNFDLNFTKLDDRWQLVLNPKKDVIKKHLHSVTIDGSKEDIDRIFIDTVNSGQTEILFECGKN